MPERAPHLELGEGPLPDRDALALDEPTLGFPLVREHATVSRAVRGAFVLDGADREPQQLHGRIGRGEAGEVWGLAGWFFLCAVDVVRS